MTRASQVYTQIPNELCRRPQWLLWKFEDRDGKWTKVPYQLNGHRASSTDSLTWSTFEEARAAFERGNFDGLGFVFGSGDPYAGVDLDGCRDRETGEVEPWAQKIVDELGGYTEVSPSGTGVHVIVRGKAANKKRDPVEAYSSERFFTVTGDVIGDVPRKIPERQAVLDVIARKYLTPKAEREGKAATNGHKVGSPDLPDEEIIKLCRKAKNGAKFSDLFDAGETGEYAHDDSRADQALVSLFAFYSDDPDQLDRLFRASALVREKWTERPDYRRRTIDHALRNRSETYRPSSSSPIGEGHRDTNFEESETPRLVSVSFNEIPDPGSMNYLLDGLIPEGYPTLVFGDGGVAKSMLALSFGLSLARGGGKWLGRDVDEYGAVLYLDFELDAPEQRRRVMRLARGEDIERVPDEFRYLSAAGHKTRDVFAAALRECKAHGVKLMVLDSFGLALDGDAEHARDVIGFIKSVLERFRAAGVTVLVIDHQASLQAGERYQSKNPFGSVFKRNLTRSVIQVQPMTHEEGSLEILIRQKKTNFGTLVTPFGAELKFTEEMVTLQSKELAAADLAEEATLTTPERVVHALSDAPKYPDEISEWTGLARKTVQNALTTLRKKGVVEDTGERNGRQEQVRLSASFVPHTRGQGHRDANSGDDEWQEV